ncbi:MAG: transporter substrate-binding domain-containing protein [Clostridiales bacterium]|nr:transporter substrate-binding domain-containing protein [Clostridiales bacterium]
MKKRWMMTRVLTPVVLGALALTACGGSTAATEAAAETEAVAETEAAAAEAEPAETEGAEATTDEITTVMCATDGHTVKFSYVDENGELAGYEADLLRAIDEILPQYEFEFEITEFESIFNGIDTGRYMLGFNSLSWNETRNEKYIFPKHYDRYEASGLYVREGLLDEHPINGLDDLGGLKTVSNAKGDAWQLFLENYNAEHADNPIEIQYADADWSSFYMQLYQGNFDFMMGGESNLQVYADEYGYDFDFVALPDEEASKLQNPSTWFVIAKTEEGQKLADAIDGAMETLKDNGTLTELSVKYWGKDYSGIDRADW